MVRTTKDVSFESGSQYGWGLILHKPFLLKQFLERLFSERGHLDILEIGAWKGHLVGWLHENFPKDKYSWNYWGIDIVEPPDRRKDYPHLIMNAQALEFYPEQFDVVIALEVVEHIPNYYEALREIYRVLKSGGGVFIQTVICNDPSALLDEQHFHVLHPKTLKRLMEWIGFKECNYDESANFSLWCRR